MDAVPATTRDELAVGPPRERLRFSGAMTAPRTRRIRTGAVPPLVVLAVLAASTSGVDLLSDGSADPPSTTRSGGHPTASAPSLPSGYIGWLTRDGTGWGPNQFVQARTRLLRLPPI